MATVVFQAAGAAIGSIFGPVGAIIGQAAGALVGGAIDQRLFATSRTISGSRLNNARLPGSDEGGAINQLYGTASVAGTLMWATRFEENISEERHGVKEEVEAPPLSKRINISQISRLVSVLVKSLVYVGCGQTDRKSNSQTSILGFIREVLRNCLIRLLRPSKV